MPEVIRTSDEVRGEPADYLREIEALVATHDCLGRDRIGPAIAAGRASRDVARRAALELYYLRKWMAPEGPMLIANAPDVYRFTMEHSTHYQHWGRTFAGEAGYLSDPNQVRMVVEWCRQLGLTDEDVRAYAPLPQTIAMVCTMLFYVRRSYEEGVAVLDYAAERVGAGRAYATALSDGLCTHYGVGAPSGAIPAAAEAAGDLFRMVAITRPAQDRCREAIRNVLSTAGCRVRAMNRWLE